MADKRPWAKIDTGYILNPKWFQIERHLRDVMPNAMPLAIANAIRTAKEAHMASILYCAQNVTDGLFPVRAIKAICAVQDETEEAAITALFESGMWINHPGGMAEVRDFLEHQTPSSSLKELTEKRREAGKKGAAARWQNDGKCHSKDVANATVDKKRREEILRANFDEWYSHYPKKVGKPSALKAFRTAIKKISLEDLIAATDLYANSVKGVDPKFIKGPGPWLNDERWEAPIYTVETPKKFDPWENIQ